MTDEPTNGNTPAEDDTAIKSFQGLGLGSQFNPFAPGAYEWRRAKLLATIPGNREPVEVTVYLLIWSNGNGRHICNIIGDDAMGEFLRSAQKQFSGLFLLPPGSVPPTKET